MSISVVIATYGDRKWNELALRRARASAMEQSGDHNDQVICHHYHNETLSQARNFAAKQATRDWLIFLDGDDELEPGYLEAMMASPGDLVYPSVRYVPSTDTPEPIVIPWKPLVTGNHMVIGTMMRRIDFFRVGGFSEYPAYEDWQLFLKLTYAGAERRLAEKAIYRAHVNPTGRNYVPNAVELFHRILAEFWDWCQEFDGGKSKVPEFKDFLKKFD